MVRRASPLLLALIGLPPGLALPTNDVSIHYGPPSYGSQTVQGPPNSCSSSLGPGVEHHEVGGGNGTTSWPYQIYKSSPFNPPVMEINRTGDSTLAPGFIFVTPSDLLPISTTKQPAPYIYTDKGQLVWSGPTVNSTNFKFQNYNGQPTMTYWSGLSTDGANVGHGYGNITFLDNTYKTKLVICPKFGLNTLGDNPDCEADIHESHLTDRNTLIMSAYNATPADLSAVGGPADGWIWDSQFFEVDPSNGTILFRWSSFEHVPVTESKLEIGDTGNSTSPYDYFHINSVVNIGNNFLVNGRHVWTTYYLSPTGDIEWQFEGETGGDFGPLPENGTFRWEHHVRPHNITDDSMDISIFNNDNSGFNFTLPTDLLVYHIPRQPKKNSTESQAVLKRNQQNHPQLYVGSQGSYQPDLSNGNQFSCFGQLPILKEYDINGKNIWTGRIGPDNFVQVYRGFKEDWHGTPYTKPDLVVENGKGYVSWNGATDVTVWNVYAGTSKQQLRKVGEVGFKGFETMFGVICGTKYVQVGAVEGGKEVSKSEIVKV